MKATFNDVDDLARFCAGLTREQIDYEVRPASTVGYYDVIIIAPEVK